MEHLLILSPTYLTFQIQRYLIIWKMKSVQKA